jgi:hypothetical protein
MQNDSGVVIESRSHDASASINLTSSYAILLIFLQSSFCRPWALCVSIAPLSSIFTRCVRALSRWPHSNTTMRLSACICRVRWVCVYAERLNREGRAPSVSLESTHTHVSLESSLESRATCFLLFLSSLLSLLFSCPSVLPVTCLISPGRCKPAWILREGVIGTHLFCLSVMGTHWILPLLC